MKSLGNLYFVPVTLGDDNIDQALPKDVISIVQNLSIFIVENEKTARRFLGLIKTHKPLRELTFHLLNEHTKDFDLPSLIEPLLNGENVGLMSEAGCPGIADPGAKLAEIAHKKGIQVKPLVGPSSIIMALMASGLNGQRFTFLGYLPTDKSERINRLKEIQTESMRLKETQIFIETPYRNQHLLEDIIQNCSANVRLCIASNVSLENEYIKTRRISEWKNGILPNLHKIPTVFLMLAGD